MTRSAISSCVRPAGCGPDVGFDLGQFAGDVVDEMVRPHARGRNRLRLLHQPQHR